MTYYKSMRVYFSQTSYNLTPPFDRRYVSICYVVRSLRHPPGRLHLRPYPRLHPR